MERKEERRKKKSGGAKEKSGGKKSKSKSSRAHGDWADDKNKAGGRAVDILDEAAMENAVNICHNVQDLLFFRGFFWEGQNKKAMARKTRGRGTHRPATTKK